MREKLIMNWKEILIDLLGLILFLMAGLSAVALWKLGPEYLPGIGYTKSNYMFNALSIVTIILGIIGIIVFVILKVSLKKGLKD